MPEAQKVRVSELFGDELADLKLSVLAGEQDAHPASERARQMHQLGGRAGMKAQAVDDLDLALSHNRGASLAVAAARRDRQERRG